jgi:hypothetical protein
VDFRSALAGRWRDRPVPLSAEETRFFLSELWTRDAAPLPERHLRALGGLWPRAVAWLERVPAEDRPAALEAMDALPGDPSKLWPLLAQGPEPESDVVRLILLRVHLLRGEDDRAVALLDEVLREAERGGFDYTPAPLAPPADEESEGGAEPQPVGDAGTARLRAYWAPFREAGRAALAAARLSEALRARLRPGPATADSWALALELAPAGEARSALAAELDRAFLRGDLRDEDLVGVADAVARFLPAEAPRWIDRAPAAFTYDAVAARVRLLRRLGDRARAARVLVDARSRGLFTAAEEVRAFDLWRGTAPPAPAKDEAVEPWTAARTFWTEKPADVGRGLVSHLATHPFDVRAARAALRSVAPADDDLAHRAAAVLRESAAPIGEDVTGDETVLRVRSARGFLPRSPAAARTALGSTDARWLASELRRRRFPSVDVLAATLDVARIEQTEERGSDRALAALEDLDPAAARTLRAEVRPIPPGPWAYRLEGGRPVPWRPRDLDWSLLARVLAARPSEEAR